ncbi:MAG: hypothetical protein ACRCX2_13425 [Paraclostridium sp.]
MPTWHAIALSFMTSITASSVLTVLLLKKVYKDGYDNGFVDGAINERRKVLDFILESVEKRQRR